MPSDGESDSKKDTPQLNDAIPMENETDDDSGEDVVLDIF
jgi:hypothetical protein